MEYPRVWGINVGRVNTDDMTKCTLLDDGDTDMVTTAGSIEYNDNTVVSGVMDLLSGEDTDNNNEDFAAEKLPRPPPVEPIYNKNSTCTSTCYYKNQEQVGKNDREADAPTCSNTEVAALVNTNSGP